jgi:predicted transcriptional regulator
MLKSNMLRFALAASVCVVIAVPSTASAAKRKISYEEAFKRCKAFIDKEKGGFASSTTNEMTRTRRGAACMQKFGYKL